MWTCYQVLPCSTNKPTLPFSKPNRFSLIPPSFPPSTTPPRTQYAEINMRAVMKERTGRTIRISEVVEETGQPYITHLHSEYLARAAGAEK